MKSIHIALFAALLLLLAACSENEPADAAKINTWNGQQSELGVAALIEAELSNLSGATNSVQNFSLEVPAGATDLVISTSGGTGDVDLFVELGSQPTRATADCSSEGPTNAESCAGASPRAGRYFITLFGASAYRGVTLSASFDDGSDTPAPPAPDPTPDPEDPAPTPDPAPSGEYNIRFVFGGNITAAQRQLFVEAGERWEEVIVGDLPTAQVNKPAGRCGQGEPALNGAVDDIVIYAAVEPRDGRGGVLASAGPCLVRNGGLTSYGVMNFDSADSNGPELFETILHEMGHVLGIGTLWTSFGLTNYTGGCPRTPRYTGTNAVRAWQNLGGSGDVPVEEDGGGGTACGHFDEQTFDTELMTGFSEGAPAEPLSLLTVGSLQDLGYRVNASAADSYSLPSCSPNCVRAEQTFVEGSEILLTPIGTTDADGNIVELND